MNNSIYAKIRDDCCTGCGACEFVCPKNAINISADSKGFLKYKIDFTKCINCGICSSVCHKIKPNQFKNQIKVYGAYSKNDFILNTSRSGGIFYHIAEEILNKGGVVFGASFDEKFNVKHIMITKKDELCLLQGSKYVQSDFRGVLSKFIKNNKNGIVQLISGTPCQISSIRKLIDFYDLKSEIIVLVDIVCHGTPSIKVWNDYKKYVCKNDNLVAFDFRDKNFGWESHFESAYTSLHGKITTNVFRDLFYSHLVISDNCFSCSYKRMERQSDITLADFWGIKEHFPDLYNKKGNSLVILNSEKGIDIFNTIKPHIFSFELNNKNDFVQPGLSKTWPKPKQYDDFWSFYNKKGFKKACIKYGFIRRKSVFHYAKSFLRKVKNKCLKK